MTAFVKWIYSLLYQDAAAWQEGYWGGVPYLLLLRALVCGGIVLRYALHPNDQLPIWMYVALIVSLSFAVFLHCSPNLPTRRALYSAMVCLDIIVVTGAYWHTGERESDFFLFYYLPIFTAAEHLGARWVVAVFSASTVSLAIVILLMPNGAREFPSGYVFARVFMPREVFYVAITLVWALRLRRERDSRQRSIVRQQQMQQLLNHKQHVEQIFSIEEVLRFVVSRTAEDLNAVAASGIVRIHRNGKNEEITSSTLTEGIDERTREVLERAIRGHDELTAKPVVALGQWAGAIAVEGLQPRELIASKEYLMSAAQLIATAYDRARLLVALREIGEAATAAAELNQRIDTMLNLVVDELGLEYAIISLVDSYKDRITTVRGRNVPPGWIAASDHDVNGDDILADVARTQRTEVFDEWDERFNKQIWNRYNHRQLARVFAPIVSTVNGRCQTVGGDRSRLSKRSPSRGS